MRRVLPSVGAVLLSPPVILLLLLPCASAAVLHVKADAPGSADGASWATAFPTVQGALKAAASGDEVWVAAGTYTGTSDSRIALTAAVSLLGGFAGTEASAPERDPAAHTTTLTLDPSTTGAVIDVQASGAVVDGFTIRGGYGVYGGGVACWPDVSAVISHNVITENGASRGGGIYCYAETRVLDNVITNNRANSGAGITCAQGRQTVAGNTITDNDAGYNGSGGGIALLYSDATVVNNVIRNNQAKYGAALFEGTGTPVTSGNFLIADNVMVGNLGLSTVTIDGQTGGRFLNNTIIRNASLPNNTILSAVLIDHISPTPLIANNLIAFNTGTGLTLSESLPAGETIVRQNDLFGNTTDVSGPDGATDRAVLAANLAADPRIASTLAGLPHLQPDSPCVDAGDSTLAATGDTDEDGQPRLLGNAVDIGADETDGTIWPWHPQVIRVNGAAGDDSNDGSAWDKAYKTLTPAFAAAAENGAEVWLAKGTYHSYRVSLPYGVAAYGGFAGNEMAREARSADPALTVLDGGGGGTVVTVLSGSPDTTVLDGVTVANGATGLQANAGAPFITNVIVRDNSGTGITAHGGPLISRSEVRGNGKGGIDMGLSQTQVTDCLITGNTSPDGVGGIVCSSAQGLIARNTISGNQGRALYLGATRTRVVDNLITGNGETGGTNGAVYIIGSRSAPSLFANNTVADNPGGGVTVDGSGTIENNVIAFNGSVGLNITAYASGSYHHNLVWANGTADYFGVTANPTDVQKDPLFTDRANGNYHLAASSPAIDAGDDTAISTGDTDRDGLLRRLGAHVDLGAFEYPTPGYHTLADAFLALRAAAGFLAPDAATVERLGVSGSHTVDVPDAVALARKAAGLDVNP